MVAQENKLGRLVSIMGPVVDIQFDSGHLPDINNAIIVDVNDERSVHLTLEAAQHLGNNSVRCVALGSTDGLSRGLPARDTGAPIHVPVGREVLGRIFNVLGEPVDGKEAINTNERFAFSFNSLVF